MEGNFQSFKASVGLLPPDLDIKFIAPSLWGRFALITEEAKKLFT